MSAPDGRTFTRLDTRVVYETRYMRLREDDIRRPDGSEGIYSYVEKPDFALVIAAENDGFHLVEQYRYPLGRRRWEFPQGALPDLRTGDPEALARDELRQETGLIAGTIRHLGRLDCAPGMASQGCDVFLATDLTQGETELEIEEQDLVHRWFPRDEVEEMIRSAAITDNASLAAYTLYLLRTRTP